MKSYSAYFVKSEINDKIRRMFKLEPVTAVPDSPWLVCNLINNASPPNDDVLWGEKSLTAAKSELLGEVIFLYASTPDSLAYEHSNNGKLIRKLVWFPMLDDDWTPGWLYAYGEREEWENILFSPQNLARVLEEEEIRVFHRPRAKVVMLLERLVVEAVLGFEVVPRHVGAGNLDSIGVLCARQGVADAPAHYARGAHFGVAERFEEPFRRKRPVPYPYLDRIHPSGSQRF